MRMIEGPPVGLPASHSAESNPRRRFRPANRVGRIGAAARAALVSATVVHLLAGFRGAQVQTPASPDSMTAGSLTVAEAEAAEARLRAAIQVAPATASFHASLGAVLHAQGRFTEARDAFAEAVRLEPDHPGYRGGLAETLLSLGQWSDAEANFLPAIALAPGDSRLHEGLADALAAQGRSSEASGHLRRAAELDPSDERLAARADSARPTPGPTTAANRSPAAIALAILIRFVAYLSIAALTAAGLAMLLPVLAALALLLVVAPIQLLRGRRR